MKFKNFKKEQSKKESQARSASVEYPKLLEQHSVFFKSVERQFDNEREYQLWRDEALLYMFLNPKLKLDQIRPENIEMYSISIENQLI